MECPCLWKVDIGEFRSDGTSCEKVCVGGLQLSKCRKMVGESGEGTAGVLYTVLVTFLQVLNDF